MAGKKRVGIVLFQLGRAGLAAGRRAVSAEFVSRSRHHSHGATGLFAKAGWRRLISSRRSIPVAGKYAEIGRRSPIGLLTERQRVRLVEAVSPYIDPVAVTAMRYWHPMTAEAVDTLRKAGPLDEIVLAAAVSTFFVRHDAEQLEGMAARLWQIQWRSESVAPSDSFTITRATFRLWCNASAQYFGSFPIVHGFIWCSARMGCR